MKLLFFPLIAVVTLILIFALFSDFELTITKNETTDKYEYNGIVWVLLDRYTINKYHSKDIPMKIFNHTKTKNQI